MYKLYITNAPYNCHQNQSYFLQFDLTLIDELILNTTSLSFTVPPQDNTQDVSSQNNNTQDEKTNPDTEITSHSNYNTQLSHSNPDNDMIEDNSSTDPQTQRFYKPESSFQIVNPQH
jgi:hypothetical protein